MKFIKQNRIIFDFCFFITLLACTIGCGEEYCVANYDFQIELTISPNSFEYHKCDTISISMVTDNTALIDSAGNRIVEFPNFDPNVFFLLPRLDSTIHLDGFAHNEMVLNSNYTTNIISVGDHSSIGLFFFEIDTSELSSKLDFKIVLQQEGTYQLQINPSISVHWRSIDFPNKCNYGGRGNIDATFRIDGEQHKNIEFLSEQELNNLDGHWVGSEGSRQKSSSYFFKVIE